MTNNDTTAAIYNPEVAEGSEAEACLACGEMYAPITLLRAGKPGNRVEAYECICGRISLFYNGRRIS